MKHAFGLTIWRELDPGAGKYRVNVRLGNNSGPYPHWAQDYALEHPIAAAVDEVAQMAWRYFTSTGYATGDEPLDVEDVARTPRKLIIEMRAERQAADIRDSKRHRR